MDKIKKLTAQVVKREKEEWEYLQRIIKSFGRDHNITSKTLARWSQWNDFNNMLKQINNK